MGTKPETAWGGLCKVGVHLREAPYPLPGSGGPLPAYCSELAGVGQAPAYGL